MIAKRSPAVVLDGKDDSYITSRFDVAIEDAAQAPSAVDLARAGMAPVNGGGQARPAPAGSYEAVEEQRRAFAKSRADAWKQK